MEVTVIKWNEIPRKDWIAALDSIPIGTCVKDLPYKTLPYAPSIAIPHEGIGKPWMEFTAYRVIIDGISAAYVWKRTA